MWMAEEWIQNCVQAILSHNVSYGIRSKVIDGLSIMRVSAVLCCAVSIFTKMIFDGAHVKNAYLFVLFFLFRTIQRMWKATTTTANSQWRQDASINSFNNGVNNRRIREKKMQIESNQILVWTCGSIIKIWFGCVFLSYHFYFVQCSLSV